MPRRPLVAALIALACGPGPAGTADPGTTTTTDADTGAPPPTDGSAGTTDTTDTGPPAEPAPQQGEWEPVVDGLPFPLSGPGQVHRLTVGGKQYNDNFANRGDVDVLFDQDDEVIRIELRKYDFADPVTVYGDEAMEYIGTFARMSLWAYVDGATPYAPTEADKTDPAVNCQLETWKDDCSVYLYYDGLSQPLRAGADLRVHLPKAWRGELNLETEDNTAEISYPRRGDITVTGDGDAGWCGSGTIKLAEGRAAVRLCRDLSPAPTCPADAVAACETWPDGAWSPDCPCTADLFGQLRVESLKPWAADLTVDIPATTWLNARAANNSPNKPHECLPQISCAAGCTLTDDSTYSKAAEFNYPSPAAPAGAGYNVTVLSANCNEVAYDDDPDAWNPDTPPPSELRGHVTVCTGCL